MTPKLLEQYRERIEQNEANKVNAFEMKIIDTGQGISKEGLNNLFMDFSSLQEH